MIALPRLLRIGGGVRHELAAVLGQLGLSRPLIITDRFMADSGRADTLIAPLRAAGLMPALFADAVPDPTITSVTAACAALAAAGADCVIGFGGGSPIDTAKAVAVLGADAGAIPGDPVAVRAAVQGLKAPHQQDRAGLPILAIPTTAGTGSEATRFTIITDEASDEKLLCIGLAYLPVAALVDYELTLSMPPRLTADTGIDALTHAIEAYVSRRANPFSDGMAMLAMRAIAPNLRRVWADPGDRVGREALMLGATQAGIAFSNASVALVHGMSRPIGAFFHVPHGLSNAMLLPAVTRFSIPDAASRYADCAVFMGLVPAETGRDRANDALVEALVRLNDDLAVPSPQAYGIAPDRWDALLPVMAEQALASGSPANNPRQPTADQIITLYRQAWA